MSIWNLLFGNDHDPLQRGSRVPGEKHKEFEIIDYHFDQEKAILAFKIQRVLYLPKIVAYKTEDYVKSPVYNGFLHKQKILVKFSKHINLLHFINIELPRIINQQTLEKGEPSSSLDLKITKEQIEKLKFDIYEKLNSYPDEILKKIKIKKLETKIAQENKKLRNFANERILLSGLLKTDFPEEASNFKLRLCLVPFTIGLSFIGYISKQKAKSNAQLNAKNKAENARLEKNVANKNKKLSCEIEKHNQIIKTAISGLEQKLNATKENFVGPFKQEIVDLEKNNDFVDLLKFFEYQKAEQLRHKKGVYIIKNSTNGKTYVGQSKDLFRRIFQGHFCDGKVKNIKFAQDFNNGHKFVFKYQILETKDQLDAKQKEWIEYYDSFNSGYNKTSGNK